MTMYKGVQDENLFSMMQHLHLIDWKRVTQYSVVDDLNMLHTFNFFHLVFHLYPKFYIYICLQLFILNVCVV